MMMRVALTNDKTRAYVAAWIDRTAALPERHSIDAWMDQVDTSAGNSVDMNSITIEMRGQFTDSGNPEVLHIPAEMFDIVELPE